METESLSPPLIIGVRPVRVKELTFVSCGLGGPHEARPALVRLNEPSRSKIGIYQ
jgi:hypothetical protein